ncbi:MAG: phenylalanine--tRNA ligase subunit beta [Elusimicrobia bacterium]|nr:phenylalanine--tRNA ligase subunit beta [Elusimicrobiota bacterium]
MKFLLSWIEEFLPQPSPPVEEMVKALEGMGLSVAGLERHPVSFEGIIVAHVESVGPHPNADRLRLARVFDGSQRHEVVCGAPNLAERQRVAFAPVGAKLRPIGETKDFVITPKKIRDVESRGMICSTKELGLGSDHDGIVVLPDGWELGKKLDVYIRSEVILDVELPPHRWDLTSHLGLARELSLYLWRQEPRDPRPLDAGVKTGVSVSVSIEPEARVSCLRYDGVLLDNVKVGKSPFLIKRRLELLGQTSINNIVDATNYVLLETGQPLHAFDWSKIQDEKILVRWAKQGETIAALNGEEYKLAESDLVIADGTKPVALAGVIGGENSKVTDATKKVFFECAWFSRRPVRSTSKKFGLKTESSVRFSKETDIIELERSLGRVFDLLGGASIGEAVASVSVKTKESQQAEVQFNPKQIDEILGFTVQTEELFSVVTLLCEETQKKSPEDWILTPRSWRSDLRLTEDFAEEVLRYLGFDRVPGADRHKARIAAKVSAPARRDEMKTREIADKLLEVFRGRGFNEAITYPLAGKNIDELCGTLGKALPLVNPISADLVFLRPSLLPGLYAGWVKNYRNPKKRVFLQEVGYTHNQSAGLARHQSRLYWAAIGFGPENVVHWNLKEPKSFDLWDMIGLLDGFVKSAGLALNRQGAGPVFPSFHPLNGIKLSVGKSHVGYAAQLTTPETLDPRCGDPVIYAELDLTELGKILGDQGTRRFEKIPAAEPIGKDLAVIVADEVSWEKIESSVKAALGHLLGEIYPFDVYTSPKLGKNKKSVAFRVIFAPQAKTPTQEDINGWLKTLTDHLTAELKAVLRDRKDD